jgi:hypothetical protein
MSMRSLRPVTLLVSVALLLAACGGSGPAATQNPGTAQSQTAGGATPTPDTGGGGGGGGNGGTNNSVHYEVSGPKTASGDLAFVSIASVFGGMQQTSLSFSAGDASSEVMAIIITQGKLGVSFGNGELAVTGADCTTTNLSVDASHASGSFDCPAIVITSAGVALEGSRIKGTFDAHK